MAEIFGLKKFQLEIFKFYPRHFFSCLQLMNNVHMIQKNIILLFSFFAAPPRIVLDPPYQIVRQGDSARIICTATGDQPIQIQWAKQGQPYLPRSVTARGGQLAFQSISLDDQGKSAKLIHFICLKSRRQKSTPKISPNLQVKISYII